MLAFLEGLGDDDEDEHAIIRREHEIRPHGNRPSRKRRSSHSRSPRSRSRSSSPVFVSSSRSRSRSRSHASSTASHVPVNFVRRVGEIEEKNIEKANLTEFVSLRSDTCDDREEDDDIDDKKWCFLCEYSQDAVDAENNPHFKSVLEFLEANFGEIDALQLAKDAQKMYDTNLRPYTEAKKPWSLQSIYRHAAGKHAPREMPLLLNCARRVDQIMEWLEESIAQKAYDMNGKARKTVHPANTKLFLQLVSAQTKLLSRISSKAPSTRLITSGR